MAAVGDAAPAAAPNGVDQAGRAGEDEGVEKRRGRDAAKGEVVGLEREKVGGRAGDEAAGGAWPAERSRAAAQRRLHHRRRGGAVRRRQHVAVARGEAQRVFELPQLRGDADLHVGVRADAVCGAGGEHARRGERPVAEVGFGDGAKADDRARRREPRGFGLVHVGGVDQAPAPIDGGLVEQPVDRAPPAPGAAVRDLLDLLGDVDVDRAVRRHRQQRVDLVGRDGAQTVRGDADRGAVGRARQPSAGGEQCGETVEIAGEAALGLGRRGAAEVAMRVEHRQQGEADAARRRRRGDAHRHLRSVGIGAPVRRVVEVVELADAREAGLQHLDVEQGRDRLHLVGRHGVGEAVHGVAPAPEAVGPAAAPLGEAGHAALERVAVQVRQARQQDGDALVVRRRRDAALDRSDAGSRDVHPHVLGPPVRGERHGGVEDGHGQMTVMAGLAGECLARLVICLYI